jgi:hypothetical protein
VKCFVGLVKEMESDDCKIKFLRKWPTSWIFGFPKTEGTAIIDQGDIVLKLPDPVVAGSSRRIVTDFGIDLLGYSVN